MKKIILAALVSCFCIPSVFAADTSAVTALDLIPHDSDVVIEINTNVENPIESVLIGLIKSGFKLSSETDKSALIEGIFSDNNIVLAMNNDPSSNYLVFTCKASELTGLLPENYAQENYNGYTIYSNADDEMYGSFVKNFCVFSNTAENLKKIIDGGYSVISGSTGYKNFTGKRDLNSFVSLFMDPSVMLQNEALDYSFMQALIAEGFAFTEIADGIKMNMYFEGDSQKLADLDFAFNKYNFVPKLYTKISGSKLIAYIGAKNLSGSIEDALKLMVSGTETEEGMNEIFTELSAILGIDVQTDLFPVLTGEYLLTVHDSGTQMPAFTLMFDVSNNLSSAQNAAAAMNAKIKETYTEIEETEQNEFYSDSEKTVQGTLFTEHKFINTYDPEADPFYLNIGVSSDGLFVITTHPDPAAIYKADAGLTVNAEFKAYFTNPAESIRQIMFVDMEAFKNYIIEAMTASGAGQTDIDEFNAMFGPWKNIYSKTYATQNQQWGDVIIKVDTEMLAGLGEIMNSYMEMYTAKPVKFCDVNESDWFYYYVSNLSVQGVVEGYPDGCFRPGNEITRAEFIKMVLVKKGLYGMYQSSDQSIFKDIRGDEWYAQYVNEAAVYNYIKGYEDGTFKPNNPITRAEALQIISNVNMLYSMDFMVRDEPFTDVNESDWFYDAVRSAYTMGVVQGINADTFEPYRYLTRAEAAKMLFMGL